MWEKEKMLVTRIFSYSHNVFYPIKDKNLHFSNFQFVVCKCFEFGSVKKKKSVWLRVYYRFFFSFPDFSGLSLEDVDSVSEADRDTLAPLPPPQWNNQYPYSSSNYLPQNLSYVPPYSYASTDSQSFVGSFVDGADSRVGNFPGPGGMMAGNNSTGSVHSGSGGEYDLLLWCCF